MAGVASLGSTIPAEPAPLGALLHLRAALGTLITGFCRIDPHSDLPSSLL
jgi:hypothetical protein